MKHLPFFTTFALLLLCCLTGCDNGRSSVTGKVTYQGQPVETGSISFEPIDGKGGTSGGAIEQGQFTLGGKTGEVSWEKTREHHRGPKDGPTDPGGTTEPGRNHGG